MTTRFKFISTLLTGLLVIWSIHYIAFVVNLAAIHKTLLENILTTIIVLVLFGMTIDYVIRVLARSIRTRRLADFGPPIIEVRPFSWSMIILINWLASLLPGADLGIAVRIATMPMPNDFGFVSAVCLTVGNFVHYMCQTDFNTFASELVRIVALGRLIFEALIVAAHVKISWQAQSRSILSYYLLIFTGFTIFFGVILTI